MTQSPIDTIAASTAAARPDAVLDAREHGVPVVNIVVPVYNEQPALGGSIRRLHRYVAETLPFSARITFADNASICGRDLQQVAAVMLGYDQQMTVGRGVDSMKAHAASSSAIIVAETAPDTMPQNKQ